MQIFAIGLHRNNVPENLWYQGFTEFQTLKTCAEDLSSMDIQGETLFVNSSHSIEVFSVTDDETKTREKLENFLLTRLNLKKNAQDIRFHLLEGPDAVRHFFQLSLGLEPFIQDPQNEFIENASKSIAIANECGNAAHVLNRLFQTALMLAGKLEQSGLSFDYSFISKQIENLAQKIFGPLHSVDLMVVGSNELSQVVLKSMGTESLRHLYFLHRSSSLISKLAQSAGGQVVNPEDVDDKLANVQVVLRMNQNFASHFSAAILQKIMGARKNQPLLIINLDTTVVPEASLSKIYNLFVYDLTDFQQHKTSKDGIGYARELIETELKQFFSWFYSKEHYRFGDIIGKSKPMEHILELIARISQTNITVLIEGESGTGKELVARAIHENSPRRNKPFIVVNCGALPDTLLESELFGHVRGAFTGAEFQKKGLLEEADGGTLMLDEIGDTSPAFQVKLLRVLQQGEMRRLGSNEVRKIDVRIIAATNKHLDELVQKESFRKDLYYRLNVVQIDIPPLRAHPEDILLLADHFIAKYGEKIKKRVIGLDKEAGKLILNYSWPGNVRELENAIERSVALCIGHTILPEDLPPQVRNFSNSPMIFDDNAILPLKELEKQHIARALRFYHWDYEKTARQLGIGRTTLWRKMKEYGIER